MCVLTKPELQRREAGHLHIHLFSRLGGFWELSTSVDLIQLLMKQSREKDAQSLLWWGGAGRIVLQVHVLNTADFRQSRLSCQRPQIGRKTSFFAATAAAERTHSITLQLTCEH